MPFSLQPLLGISLNLWGIEIGIYYPFISTVDIWSCINHHFYYVYFRNSHIIFIHICMWQRACLLKILKSWFSATYCHCAGPLGHSILLVISNPSLYRHSGIDCRPFFSCDSMICNLNLFNSQ